MKREQLEKANEVTMNIKLLKDHLDKVFYQRDAEEPFSSIEARILTFQSSNYSTHTLINKYLPIPIKTYMKFYMDNIKEQIANLEEELEQL